ncbi:nuclear transport factor 2 family protein [Commensalibacter nepenthis]|uniref:Nuclear transport factor 2 family protein n=1 Tax=Commensalibacter nepenthis TaxID=3043872 RepID=A0ABT6Q6J6_9PROT|nr:nuclear transport factor 2 family protein [Commensalibacter sp. TBRC 10068]MDI2112521.1 nuclear transport factor 2 family protein [Commensalibacter sp. TBRC 10068]
MSKEQNKALVLKAHNMLFSDKDIKALELYFSPDFIEHSPLVADGIPGLKELVASCPDMNYKVSRVLGDDSGLVALHGRFVGLDENPLVGFDIYRVENGKIVEHWDGLVAEAEKNISGRTQLDGPTAVDSNADSEANRQLVKKFFTETLIGGDYSGFERYSDGTTFYQHSPDIGDGVQPVINFLEQLKADGTALHYDKIHRTVADGQFVLTHSEGSIAGARHAYFELWRVENGKIIELWDSIPAVPSDEDAVHNYGIF